MSSGTATPPAYKNKILQLVPAEEFARLRGHLTRVRLVNGQVLHGPGERMEQVFFVEQGFVSMVAEAEDETSRVEVGLIGPEGMVGLTSILSAEPRSYNRAMVQQAGIGYSMLTSTLVAGLDRMPVLHGVLLREIDVFLAQVSQTAACNGRHVLAARLARWLLLALDRVEGNEVALTQELLAIMLAVRRSGVTIAVQALETAGVIRHSRGRIIVCDRPGLEAAACNCYGKVQRFAALCRAPLVAA